MTQVRSSTLQEDDEDLDAIMAELQAEHEGKKAPPTAEELKVTLI